MGGIWSFGRLLVCQIRLCVLKILHKMIQSKRFVTDALNRSYSLDDLDQLCKEYWDDWSSKHEDA